MKKIIIKIIIIIEIVGGLPEFTMNGRPPGKVNGGAEETNRLGVGEGYNSQLWFLWLPLELRKKV